MESKLLIPEDFCAKPFEDSTVIYEVCTFFISLSPHYFVCSFIANLSLSFKNATLRENPETYKMIDFMYITNKTKKRNSYECYIISALIYLSLCL